jgi:selenocysteine lyase/cysteine desulfurase
MNNPDKKFTKWRALFPVTEKTVFLNNAAESPLNLRTKAALDEYTSLALESPHLKQSPRQPVRERCARLYGGQPLDYALVGSTGLGIGMAARGFPWQKGDNVVLPADEHWNNTFPWLALGELGVDVRLVEPGKDERVTPESMAEKMDGRTRMVACAAVRFNTGFRADLKAISNLAHDRGALFLVDAIQGAGVYPIDLMDLNIDIMAAAGFKWQLGLPGSGFLYINPRARERIRPTLPGMFAAESHFRRLSYLPDARRYETGTFAYPLFHAWTAGLDLLAEIGIPTIHARVLALTDRLIAGLRDKKVPIASPVDRPEERSAIVTFTLGSPDKNQALVEKLAAQNIIVALRDGRVRVSPNFYNNEAEIDTFLDAL